MSNEPRFEIYLRKASVPVEEGPAGATYSSSTDPEYGWRYRAANGQISAVGGEGFTRRENAHRAVTEFVDGLINDKRAFAKPGVFPPIVDTDD